MGEKDEKVRAEKNEVVVEMVKNAVGAGAVEKVVVVLKILL